MEIAKEANQVLDKLAEILGSTSGEVIEIYTEKMFYAGIVDAILCLVFVVLVCASLKVTRKGHSLVESKIAGDKGFAYIIIGIFGFCIGAIGAIASLSSAVMCLMAPKAMAIQGLIKQLSAF
ncbi:MAG: hypothetical protein BA863_10335 [Desulfovibrio sp. S3730MH75]|nr:MAG: hypothetical protein BA863_10335 [Desulfovibrio sp. S3730MH75]